MIPIFLVSLYTLSFILSTWGSVCACETLGAVYTEIGLLPYYAN
jgi:hypothetical protein